MSVQTQFLISIFLMIEKIDERFKVKKYLTTTFDNW